MDRYQVKTKSKAWSAPGPDLLRTRANATAQARAMLPAKGKWYWRKQRPDGTWFGWREIGNRAAITKWLADALPGLNDNQIAQIGRKGPARIAPRVVIRARKVPVPDLDNATPRAEVGHALIRAAFPDIKFAGCFVCKRYNGSTDPSVPFSDHAWGDAVDETENPPAGITNDAVSDWCVRMAREDLLAITDSGYILGSIKGEVHRWSAPDFKPARGGPDSHTWHVHISFAQHSGRPACA